MMGPIIIGGAGRGGPGTPGIPVEIGVSATHIRWRYVGTNDWTNIVAMADLIGPAGDDGLSVELQKTATHVQWRQVGGAWANLVALTDITGPAGASAIMSTLLVTKVTASGNVDVRASAPAGTTHIRFTAIGGGASGMSLTNLSNSAFGGAPGLVRTVTLPIADVPLGNIAAVIGAGGVGFSSTTSDWTNIVNWTRAGGETSLAGIVKAGGGVTSAGFASAGSLLNLLSSTYIPSPPGSIVPAALNGADAIDGTFGPGGGGAGAPGWNGSAYVAAIGGKGAASNAGDPINAKAGGVPASAAVGGNGQAALGNEDFGSGGAGGGSAAGTATTNGSAGGNGGIPGGGGGGANRGARSGDGARGELRIFYLKQG
jgi:hypothetical protein